MPLGLTVALALAAQAAPAAGAADAVTSPAEKRAISASADACRSPPPNPATGEIVVCAERPEGYRIDPDILTVKRMKRGGGRPARPGPGGARDTSPCAVGPHGCPSAGINLMAAALTAADMARRLAEGRKIGSMFVTDPTPDEYQLYVMAKRAREAAEEEQAAKAMIARVRAEQAARDGATAAKER